MPRHRFLLASRDPRQFTLWLAAALLAFGGTLERAWAGGSATFQVRLTIENSCQVDAAALVASRASPRAHAGKGLDCAFRVPHAMRTSTESPDAVLRTVLEDEAVERVEVVTLVF